MSGEDEESVDNNSRHSESRTITSTSTPTTKSTQRGGRVQSRPYDDEPLKEILRLLQSNNIHRIREKGSISANKKFAEICFPPLIGKQRWKVQHQHCALSSLLTVADEALASIVVENNFEEWKIKAKGSDLGCNKRMTRYTHGGVDAKGTRKGWSLDGRKRYNKMFDEIQRLRGRDIQCKILEDTLMNRWKAESKVGSGKRKLDDMHEDTNALEIEEENFVPRKCVF